MKKDNFENPDLLEDPVKATEEVTKQESIKNEEPELVKATSKSKSVT